MHCNTGKCNISLVENETTAKRWKATEIIEGESEELSVFSYHEKDRGCDTITVC